jgi:hypothetical protein
LIVEVNLPKGRTTMIATPKVKPSSASIGALWGQIGNLFKRLAKEPLQEALEAETAECIMHRGRLVNEWRVGL